MLLEDELHAREINLHILTGICAGIHRPNAASIADKMLFMVAARAAEMERDLIRERTKAGLSWRSNRCQPMRALSSRAIAAVQAALTAPRSGT